MAFDQRFDIVACKAESRNFEGYKLCAHIKFQYT